MEIKSIEIEFEDDEGTKIKMSTDAAKRLYEKLDELFGGHQVNIPPVPYVPQPYPWRKFPEITWKAEELD